MGSIPIKPVFSSNRKRRFANGTATRPPTKPHWIHVEQVPPWALAERRDALLAKREKREDWVSLAENGAAIQHFRREGIVFVGPTQDVVERAGDKRKFRALAEAQDPAAVTPGIVLDSNDPAVIVERIEQAHAAATEHGGHGLVIAQLVGGDDAGARASYSPTRSCPQCGFLGHEQPHPRWFSFNHHSGACP
jgi:hypothetical protein